MKGGIALEDIKNIRMLGDSSQAETAASSAMKIGGQERELNLETVREVIKINLLIYIRAPLLRPDEKGTKSV
jgi:hypothetical protein